MELRVRTSLGSDIRELVACRGLNEAWNASVDVVAHEAPAKVHMLRTVLEVPVLKHCDVASQESTVMSSASLVERARIGARADFHEKAAPLQHKTYHNVLRSEDWSSAQLVSAKPKI
jgi:hypothetical protein